MRDAPVQVRRLPLVGGNWKMNTDAESAERLAGEIAAGLGGAEVHVAVFPPFPYLLRVGAALSQARSPIRLGAQNFYHRSNGAYTGEVSLSMLADCGVRIVLAGHSERRHIFGESDELVAAKAAAALDAGFECILCIGETLEERRAGRTDEVNARQLRAALAAIPAAAAARLTIAYEPVWAIGTGQTATPADAQDAQAKVRRLVAELLSPGAAGAIRILYGGSVTAKNAPDLFAQPDVDGGLVGGASLKAEEFLGIIRAAGRAKLRP